MYLCMSVQLPPLQPFYVSHVLWSSSRVLTVADNGFVRLSKHQIASIDFGLLPPARSAQALIAVGSHDPQVPFKGAGCGVEFRASSSGVLGFWGR